MSEITTDKMSLEKVISKIKGISAHQYSSKTIDNILPIYNQLNTEEKKVFLKGLFGVMLAVEGSLNVTETSTVRGIEVCEVLEPVVLPEGIPSRPLLSNEIWNIEYYNKLELIKLKTWLVKAGVYALMAFAFVVITLVFMLGTGKLEPIGKSKEIWDAIKEMFS